MIFFKLRHARKELKEILHHARHVRHMYEDIGEPEKIHQLKNAETAVRKIRNGRDIALMERAGGELLKACEKTVTPHKDAKIRENIEVLFVAIAAAMAIRAYFFQPFKIPTGSMQPTLYGITVQQEPTIKGDNPLVKVANLVLFGERRKTVIAKESGYLRTSNYGTRLDLQTTKSQSEAIFFINNVPHKVPMSLWHEQAEHFLSIVRENNGYIQKGEVLFDGTMKSGDYILVNRIKYNFIRPKRGDIAVFDTRALSHPQVRKDAYYIKRMVGLPGDRISIDPPYLLVNGEKPTDPRFDKIFHDTNYDGYVLGSSDIHPVLISNRDDSITVGKDQYLFFGDNTKLSLDGRYFGPVNRKQILGPAFFVCWPFDRAGFAEISH